MPGGVVWEKEGVETDTGEAVDGRTVNWEGTL